jgi:hypothetical protein
MDSRNAKTRAAVLFLISPRPSSSRRCFIGWLFGAGILYSLAVILLFCFALAGAIAIGLLLYALFRRWCELRGAPPKGQGTREKSGTTSAPVPSTIYKRPDPLIYSQYFFMARGFAVTWDNPDISLTELPAPDGTMTPVPSTRSA